MMRTDETVIESNDLGLILSAIEGVRQKLNDTNESIKAMESKLEKKVEERK